MKLLIVFALIVASALAAPPKQSPRQSRASNDDSANAQILKYENDNIGNKRIHQQSCLSNISFCLLFFCQVLTATTSRKCWKCNYFV